MSEREYYVYLHKNPESGEVFYVGKGKVDRAYIRSGRSRYWDNYVAKHGIDIEIYRNGMHNVCAYILEKILINFYKSIGQAKCNISLGGIGIGVIAESSKEKMRLSKIGKAQSPEHAQKSRTAKIGKKQPQSAIDHLVMRKSVPIINSNGEVFPSANEAARVMSKRLGVKCSQGNISTCAIGGRNNAYGVTWSYELDNVPEFIPTVFQKKMVIHEASGSIFESVTAAVEWVKSIRGSANNQCISQAARGGGTAYGSKWRYIYED